MANIHYSINRSLQVNPPELFYNNKKGINFVERVSIDLTRLIIVDEHGTTLQPRRKDKNPKRTDIFNSFSKGILYDKDTMVIEKRKDTGEYELISGFNRLFTLKDRMGVKNYFADVVIFDSPLDKSVWKRGLNYGEDHTGNGQPSTVGDILNGLYEIKRENSIDVTDDDAVLEQIDRMFQEKGTPEQLKKVLKKFRETTSRDVRIRALNSPTAKEYLKTLGIHSGGLHKTTQEVAYILWENPTVSHKFFTHAQYFDQYCKEPFYPKIKLYGFLQEVNFDKIDIQRQAWMQSLERDIENLKKYIRPEYYDMYEFVGFISQIISANPKDGGRPKERGIVDVHGNIIIDEPNLN